MVPCDSTLLLILLVVPLSVGRICAVPSSPWALRGGCSSYPGLPSGTCTSDCCPAAGAGCLPAHDKLCASDVCTECGCTAPVYCNTFSGCTLALKPHAETIVCDEGGCSAETCCGDACTCLPSWQYGGKEFKGCAVAYPPSQANPAVERWCYVSSQCADTNAFTCGQEAGSSCTSNGVLKWKYCSDGLVADKPCECEGRWKAGGCTDKYSYRCPSERCDDPSKAPWCPVQNAPCATVPNAGGFAECYSTMCECLTAWTYKGAVYYGCAETPDNPGYSWCYVQNLCTPLGAGRESWEMGDCNATKDAPSDCTSDGSLKWMRCGGKDKCECLESWKWNGVEYKGCALTPDFNQKWCYVSPRCSTNCTKATGSSCTVDGEYGVRVCTEPALDSLGYSPQHAECPTAYHAVDGHPTESSYKCSGSLRLERCELPKEDAWRHCARDETCCIVSESPTGGSTYVLSECTTAAIRYYGSAWKSCRKHAKTTLPTRTDTSVSTLTATLAVSTTTTLMPETPPPATPAPSITRTPTLVLQTPSPTTTLLPVSVTAVPTVTPDPSAPSPSPSPSPPPTPSPTPAPTQDISPMNGVCPTGYEAVSGRTSSFEYLKCDNITKNPEFCLLDKNVSFDICRSMPNCCTVSEFFMARPPGYYLGGCYREVQPTDRISFCSKVFSPLYRSECPPGYEIRSGYPAGKDGFECKGKVPCVLPPAEAYEHCMKETSCCTVSEYAGGGFVLGTCRDLTFHHDPDWGTCIKSILPDTPTVTLPNSVPCTEFDPNNCTRKLGLAWNASSLYCKTAPCTQADEKTCCAGVTCLTFNTSLCPAGMGLVDTPDEVYCDSVPCSAADEGKCCAVPECYGEQGPIAQRKCQMPYKWMNKTYWECFVVDGKSYCGCGEDASTCALHNCKCATSTPVPTTIAPTPVPTPIPTTAQPATPTGTHTLLPETPQPTPQPSTPTPSPTKELTPPPSTPTATVPATPNPSPSPTPVPTNETSPAPNKTTEAPAATPSESFWDNQSNRIAVIVVASVLGVAFLMAAYCYLSSKREKTKRRKENGEWYCEDLLIDGDEMGEVYNSCTRCGAFSPSTAELCTGCHSALTGAKERNNRSATPDHQKLLSASGALSVFFTSLRHGK